MAEWRIRDPGSFPPAFHSAMRTAGDRPEQVILSTYTEKECAALQRDWRVFTYSLRNFPSHSLHYNCTQYSHRTKVTWDPTRRMFDLVLTTRPKAWQDMVVEE